MGVTFVQVPVQVSGRQFALMQRPARRTAARYHGAMNSTLPLTALNKPGPDGAAELPPVAAILLDGQTDVDALLADLARSLQQRDLCVHGLRMTYPAGRDGCASPMVMVDLHTGDDYLVSQPMGRDSRACRADPQGFARASAVLRRAAAAQGADAPDIVLLNRFGSLEAEGGGFRAELLALLVQGRAVLTAVAPAHREAWRSFVGGPAELPAERAAINAWLAQVLPAAAARCPGPSA